MREIKFRVYCQILKKTFFKKLSYLLNDPEQANEMPFSYEFRGQYTGLKDKNGKEIYEGDIALLKSKSGPVMYEYGSYVVKLSEYNIIELFEILEDITIIGNIHENPELLVNNRGEESGR